MDKNFSVPQTIITCISLSFGIGKSGLDPEDNYMFNIKQNIQTVVITIFYSLLGFMWINYIINFAKNEN